MLLAAHAFASQHPAARRVKVAVNLEAAGSRGKSFVLQVRLCVCCREIQGCLCLLPVDLFASAWPINTIAV